MTISFEEPGPRDTARVGRRLRAAKAAANQVEQAEGPLQLPPGIKACPACGMLIEKIGGDDNVMCGCEAKAAGGTYQKALRGGGCGHEFNFKTLASVGTGRLGHPANAKQKLFFLDQEDDDEDLVAGAPLRPPPRGPKTFDGSATSASRGTDSRTLAIASAASVGRQLVWRRINFISFGIEADAQLSCDDSAFQSGEFTDRLNDTERHTHTHTWTHTLICTTAHRGMGRAARLPCAALCSTSTS